MFTRRCSERRFFLRPDSTTTNAFWYCLGWAAQKHGMVLHAAVAMSNHVHIVASDPRGVYPDFLRDFHGILARVVNAWRGRWEHFWDANQASAVLLEGDAAELEKVAYVLANPVGLVEHASDWPGATALPFILHGKAVAAARPAHFFRTDDDGGKMPEAIEVVFVPPPSFSHLAHASYATLVHDEVTKVEGVEAMKRKIERTSVLGRDGILAQRWDQGPGGSEPRRGINPAVACRDKWLRIERLRANKLFQATYRNAFTSFRAGLEALFPCGTWFMRFRAVVQVSTA